MFYRFSAFLGMAAALLLAAAVLVYSTTGQITKESIALLILATVMAVLYAIPRTEAILAVWRTRTARQGGNATLLTVAFLGLLVVGNWFANRHSPQWDLTTARRFTLSDQSIKVVSSLDKDVQVTAFVNDQEDGGLTKATRELLKQYARRSPHITVEFIDPNKNPVAATQNAVEVTPYTIFKAGDRKETTSGVTEQDFTSALIKVTRAERKKVYFLQGHQERDPDLNQQGGYSTAATNLKNDNYEVAKLSLLSSQQVPADAAALIVAGPRVPLLDAERKAIEDYVNGGGRLLYLSEPPRDKQDLGLTALLNQWHITLGDDVVLDPGRNLQGNAAALAPVPQPGHRVSASLTDVIMPSTRSVNITPGAGSDFAIAPILKTTELAWGETNFTAQPQPNPGQDAQGPLTVAVAVNKTDPVPPLTPGAPTPVASPPSEKKTLGRIVVIGSTEFVADGLAQQVPGNRNLFSNSINWLVEDEDLISIRAEPASAPPVVLTNQARVLVFYSSVVLAPLAVLLIGAVVWWQRR